MQERFCGVFVVGRWGETSELTFDNLASLLDFVQGRGLRPGRYWIRFLVVDERQRTPILDAQTRWGQLVVKDRGFDLHVSG